MAAAEYLSAKEAAAELGVSVATLYAYVSRGIIQSEPVRGSRSRLYPADAVRDLAAAGKRPAGEDGDDILNFGAPILRSKISYTDGERLFYRGIDCVDLAKNRSVERVAALIWDDVDRSSFAEPAPTLTPLARAVRAELARARPLTACQAILPLLDDGDPQAFDRSKAASGRVGARLLRSMAALVTGGEPTDQALHERLTEAWGIADDGDVVRAALVLAADHELNASTFTVRVAASAGASLYQASAAGLASLQGARHGGEIERAHRLLTGFAAEADLGAAVVGHMRRGDPLPGFGHPLYPQGDPRAAFLLGIIRGLPSGRGRASHAASTAREVARLTGKHANFDGALATLALVLGRPALDGLCLLALGRAVGWVGHGIEQYQDHRIIRPRARYVGLRS